MDGEVEACGSRNEASGGEDDIALCLGAGAKCVREEGSLEVSGKLPCVSVELVLEEFRGQEVSSILFAGIRTLLDVGQVGPDERAD